METNKKINLDYLAECPDEELWTHAYAGSYPAQFILVFSIAHGKNGFEKNIDEIKRLADLGWVDAQEIVYLGYAFGRYGFTPNEAKAVEWRKKFNKALEEANKDDDDDE